MIFLLVSGLLLVLLLLEKACVVTLPPTNRARIVGVIYLESFFFSLFLIHTLFLVQRHTLSRAMQCEINKKPKKNNLFYAIVVVLTIITALRTTAQCRPSL